MTRTDELIGKLAADARPVARNAALGRLLTGVFAGAGVALVALIAAFGPPLQAVQQTGAAAFGMKLLYSAVLSAISLVSLFAAGRPGREPGKRWLWFLVPLALVGASAAMELSMAPPDQRHAIWLGSTWQTCLAAIVVLSLPVFAGIVWAFRILAPIRLRLSGLLAGLAAGSAGGLLYALYCPETTATFLFSWYSLGVLGAGLVGLAVGTRLLKW